MEKKEQEKTKAVLSSTKTAVAVSYEEGDQAPKILASGKGYLAEKIIEEAKKGDVPIYEDAPLAKTLSKLEIGDVIPPDLYEVVAKILIFVDKQDRIQEKVKENKNGTK